MWRTNGTPVPDAARNLSAWHGDTFVNGAPPGPSLPKLGLDDAAKSAGSVYVVSVYRAAPGHRDELEKSLAQPPGRADGIAGNVLFRHLEGGPWNFLTVASYNFWRRNHPRAYLLGWAFFFGASRAQVDEIIPIIVSNSSLSRLHDDGGESMRHGVPPSAANQRKLLTSMIIFSH